MAVMKRGKICIHESLKVSTAKVESPQRSAAFTLSSCIQNFPSPRKKPLLMTHLLKEPHSSSSHSLFIIFSIFQFPPYGLVIILWGCFVLFCFAHIGHD